MPAIASSNTQSSSQDELNNKIYVSYNYFKNLGRGGSATNKLGVVDLYAKVSEAIISHNKFENSNSRVISAKSDSENIIIAENIILSTNSVGAIQINPVSQSPYYSNGRIVISKNIIKDIYGYGILIDGYSSSYTKNVIIDNNIIDNIQGQYGKGITILRSRNVLISGNSISNTNSHGIHFYDISDNIEIYNNNISTAYYGIYGNGNINNSQVKINNNYLSTTQNYGIVITGSSSNIANLLTIQNNSINDVNTCFYTTYIYLLMIHNNSCTNADSSFSYSAIEILKSANNSWQ